MSFISGQSDRNQTRDIQVDRDIPRLKVWEFEKPYEDDDVSGIQDRSKVTPRENDNFLAHLEKKPSWSRRSTRELKDNDNTSDQSEGTTKCYEFKLFIFKILKRPLNSWQEDKSWVSRPPSMNSAPFFNSNIWIFFFHQIDPSFQRKLASLS